MAIIFFFFFFGFARDFFRRWLALDFDFRFAQRGGERVADFRGALHGMNAGGAHRLVFFRGSSLPAADDCAGVAHATSGRRGLAGDKSDDRLSSRFS